MTQALFSVEHQQLESGRYIQVLNYLREGESSRVVLGTVDNEREASAMSTALENAIAVLLSAQPT